jgi:hypothetical protein
MALTDEQHFIDAIFEVVDNLLFDSDTAMELIEKIADDYRAGQDF